LSRQTGNKKDNTSLNSLPSNDEPVIARKTASVWGEHLPTKQIDRTPLWHAVQYERADTV
jgi:hypothetical protein